MTGIEQLTEHLHRFRSAPFLFVGSGLARRYLGLETWTGLLESLSELTAHPYGYYQTRGEGAPPDIATAIAKDFFEVWWDQDEYASSREEFGSTLRGSESPLKVEVSRRMAGALTRRPDSGPLAAELEALGTAVVDGVITTNYDPLLESVFEGFRVYIGQDELLFSDAQGVGEIYKIHGCASRPDSLVLTRADYERFDERNPYLAAKLLTLFVEHPILFLGYSLSDPNITAILVSIAGVLTTDNIDQLRDRLVFVQWDPDAQAPSLTNAVVAVDGFSIPVLNLRVPDFLGLFHALAGLPRQFPARLLRRLKEHVYELVLSNDPHGRIAVVEIDSETDLADVDVVFGVGLSEELGLRGYVGLSRHELLLDVLQLESRYRPGGVMQALPKLMQGNVPMYRYLRESNLLDEDARLLDPDSVDPKIRSRAEEGVKRYLPSKQLRARAERLVGKHGNLEAWVANEKTHVILAHYGMTPAEQIDLDELRRFLLATQTEFEGRHSSLWAKLVCLYDYYAFGSPGPDRMQQDQDEDDVEPDE